MTVIWYYVTIRVYSRLGEDFPLVIWVTVTIQTAVYSARRSRRNTSSKPRVEIITPIECLTGVYYLPRHSLFFKKKIHGY